ncbi:MAG: type II toxin-antitoxin system Phd/YefM family antitoxin [Nevskia sp.]|nr:type II toxin-antitoxin system Phd/YefM family antitoxin [Nevskia sp.]
MTVTTISSREFNQDTGKAKNAAEQGPVFITDRGRYSHVLLTFAEFQRINGRQQSIAELLAMPGTEDIDFDPPRMSESPKPANLS